jgi:hypothetical protein
MKRRMTRALVAVGVASSVVAITATAAEARPAGRGQSAAITVVADHLNHPRQLTVHDGAVYVAEAGTGGQNCAEDEPCYSFTGSVTRVRHGDARRVQTGLLSITDDEGGVVGLDAVAFRGRQLLGIITADCGFTDPPADVGAQLGKVLRLRGGTAFTALADASTIECTTDPDGQEPDSDPYGIVARGRTVYVADAAGNDVVRVDRGAVSVAAVLSRTGQPVPTSLAFGPDGALYIGTLNFRGGPGGAAVLRLETRTGAVSTYAEGLTAVTSLAFDHRGTLFVTELTTTFQGQDPVGDGAVVVIPAGGGTAGRTVLGAGALHFPTGVAVGEHGVYVSNWGIAPGEDTVFGPGNHGQLVRLGYGSH